MTVHELLGWITLTSAVSMASIALPMQIIKNYKMQKVGLHWSLVILATLVYVSRAGFALTNPTGIIWYIFTGDAIGSVASLIIIYQMIKYNYRS